jgi:uncharacterized protein YggE
MRVGIDRSLAASAVLVLAMARVAAAQAPVDAALGPAIVTAGQHVIRVAPDIAFVQVVTEARAKAPRDAQRLNAAAMTAVQQKLAGAGVAAEAMQTRGLDLRPEFDYVNGRQSLREYVAMNTLEVRVEAIDRLGELIDLAVAAGAARVDNLRFDVKRRAELERDALKRAVEAARLRAEAMAAGAGRTLGAVLRIADDVPWFPEPRPAFRMAAAEAAAAAPPTPVAVGELEVRARVTVTYALYQK